MKKIVIVLILSVIICGTAFADHPDGKFGIGIMGGWYGGWGTSGYPSASLSLKIPDIPVFWGVNLSFGTGYFALGVSGDMYFLEGSLVPDVRLDWFIGLGGWLNIGFGSATDFSFGARLPIGLSWHVIDMIEIFLNVAPSLGLQVAPKVYFPAGGWPIELGIRLWF
ncbi:MAG: DUF3996 domain-containing protein [Treponema sp.]|nr:DUF3996 domain-containing protein [Treponema sp.]MCL2272652.1 DUF3996 domain-containing protein [Treponema sp.]